jgi:hypothetical protein
VSGQELYDLLPERPADVLANWREIRLKIHDEFDLAKTEEQRVALLAAFTAMMNLVEPNIAPEEREKFQMARRQDYKLLIAKECLVGENVCTETAFAVTRREALAGRMSPDESLYTSMTSAMAAPHLSRAQLIAMQKRKDDPTPKGRVSKAIDWLRRRGGVT